MDAIEAKWLGKPPRTSLAEEVAEAYLKDRATPPPAKPVAPPTVTQPKSPVSTSSPGLTWTGDVPPQKWMNFYTKVLSKYASAHGLKLTVKVEVTPEVGVSKQSS